MIRKKIRIHHLNILSTIFIISCSVKQSLFMIQATNPVKSKKIHYKKQIFNSIKTTLDREYNMQKEISKIIFEYIIPSDKQIELYLKQKKYDVEQTKNHYDINKISGIILHQYTILSKAIKENDQESLNLILLHTKLNPNKIFDQIKQWTPIFISDYQTTKLLLYHGSNANHKDRLGNTPLHNTLTKPDIKKFKILLPFTDPKIKNIYGNTVLHLAAIYKTKINMSLIIKILENDERVDKNMKNKKQKTYLDILNK